MQKGGILIWIIIGTVVVLVAGGTYYLSRSSSPKPSVTPIAVSQTPQPTPSPSDASPAPTSAGETANWKTYTTNSGKYTFKYPQNLIVKEYTQGGPPNSPKVIQPSLVITPPHTDKELSESISISVYNNSNNYSLEDWITKYVFRGPYKYTNVTIDGHHAIRSSEIPSAFEEDQVFVVNSGKIYQIGPDFC